MALRIRRGLEADRTSITPAEGELIYTTDDKLLYVGDGTTAGGILVGGTGGGISTATASGTDTYTATITGVSSYTTHDIYEIIFTNANTGSSTININSLGAKTLKKSVSTNLASGDILAGQSFFIVYDGTNFQMIGLGSGGGGGSYWALSGTSTITGATTIDGNANSILIDGNGGGITIDDSNAGGVNINDTGAGGLNITSDGGGITIEETSGGGVTVRDIATGGYVSIQGHDQGVQIETLAGNSNIQLTPHGTGSVIVAKLNLTNETASRVAIIDASKNVKSADTATYPSLTELSYVKGVTSSIQTQINALGGIDADELELAYLRSTYYLTIR